MSLTTRITLAVVSLLALSMLVSGTTYYVLRHRSLKTEIQQRLRTRMTWMESNVEVENGQLHFGPTIEAVKAAASQWEITGPDGKVLWGSGADELNPPVLIESKTITMGDPALPSVSGSELLPTSVPAAHAGDLYQMKGLLFFPSYTLPQEHRCLILILVARDSFAPALAAERGIALTLVTVGLAAVVVLAAFFALVIRWQLKPLSAMARQAQEIGPDALKRLEPAGTTKECVRLRSSINRMVDRLADGLEREKHFASMAAHEMRTPLAQLRTHIEVVLRKERQAPEYRAALEYALTDVDRLQNFIHALLQLTRTAGAPVDSGQPIPLCSFLRAAARNYGPATLALPAECEEIMIRGNEELLSVAFCNVFNNAACHAPAEPPSVEVIRDGDRVRVVVADSGPGVPEAERERIFAPLVRLDKARTVDEGRSNFGLGLTVARVAVRSFGGDLICRGRRDGSHGTEFVFDLPVDVRSA